MAGVAQLPLRFSVHEGRGRTSPRPSLSCRRHSPPLAVSPSSINNRERAFRSTLEPDSRTTAPVMARINESYRKLKAGYLFPEIGRRVAKFCAENPSAKVIRLGIGDVTEPLVPAIVEAWHKAVDEMAVRATFRGYGPEQGYDFLRQAIVAN